MIRARFLTSVLALAFIFSCGLIAVDKVHASSPCAEFLNFVSEGASFAQKTVEMLDMCHWFFM